jgi:T5orf172 domain
MDIQIQYVYLLQTREYFNSGEPIYKVGKTTEVNYTRFKQYPSGSVLLFQSVCYNCDIIEKNIMKLFKTKYVNHKIAGREYFRGDCRLMISDICHLIDNEKTNTSFVKNIVDDIVSEVIDGIVVQEHDTESFERKSVYMKRKFYCRTCRFSTKTNYCLDVHLATKKHIRNMKPLQRDDTKLHQCDTCNNGYSFKSGLYEHIKKCKGGIKS